MIELSYCENKPTKETLLQPPDSGNSCSEMPDLIFKLGENKGVDRRNYFILDSHLDRHVVLAKRSCCVKRIVVTLELFRIAALLC